MNYKLKKQEKDYDNKKPKIVKSKIESDIVSIFQDLIVHQINENGDIIPDHKKSNSFQNECEYPDQNYDWEKRINEYGIDKILIEIKKKILKMNVNHHLK